MSVKHYKQESNAILPYPVQSMTGLNNTANNPTHSHYTLSNLLLAKTVEPGIQSNPTL